MIVSMNIFNKTLLALFVMMCCACSNGEKRGAPAAVPEPPLVQAPDSVEAVDMGLPSGTKWANMNVGAEKPEDYGLYFAWAETRGYPTDTQRKFNIASYKWYDQDSDLFIKYCAEGAVGKTDTIRSVEIADDPARANWGEPWQLPAFDDILEFVENTTREWTSINGVEGYTFTSKLNGNSIFVPASGCMGPGGISNQGVYGYYWSLSLYPSDSGCARGFFFTKELARTSGSTRFLGRTVRPVCKQ